MKLEQLQLLIDIVETGSMNEASKQHYIARSSVSTSIKNLEKELGEKILDRSTKGVTLTPFGLDAYKQAKEIVEHVYYLKGRSSDVVRESLSVTSLYCSIAYEAFIDFYKESDRMNVTADVQENSLTECIRLVNEGLSDIGVVSLFAGSENITKRKFKESELEFHALMERPLYALIGVNNPLYNSTSDHVTLADLKDYPQILNVGSAHEYSWNSFIQGRTIKRANVIIYDLAVALKLVEETDAYLIETYDKPFYDKLYGASNYKMIPIKDDNMMCTLGWIKRKDRSLSLVAEKYIEKLVKVCNRRKSLESTEIVINDAKI